MTQHERGDMASWLVRRAAHRASPQLSERLEEEWLADLSGRGSWASRLRFGLGCCWAGRIIAREHGAPCAATASATSGQRLLLLQGHIDPSRWSRGTAAILGIVCVHAVLIYAFVTGLAQRVVALIPDAIVSNIIDQPQDRKQPPPLPTPRLAQPRAFESPVPQFQVDTAEGPNTIHAVPPPPQPPAVSERPTTSTTVDRIVGGPGAGFPDTDDFYPSIPRSLGEEGTSTIEVCVDSRGRLAAAPEIVHSSGHSRLDTAALDLARAGSGHYRPTTEDGRPVSSCYAFRVTFKLRD